MDYLNNCVFVDESAFDINMRPATARSASGTPAIVTTPSTRAVSHTILGAISAMGVVNIEIRLPNMKPKKIKVDGARKRKQPQSKKALNPIENFWSTMKSYVKRKYKVAIKRENQLNTPRSHSLTIRQPLQLEAKLSIPTVSITPLVNGMMVVHDLWPTEY
ncbi:hypothetical protein MUCCIDRAFT_167033 [Mucor lusitanicus CBS 277.49]|uniref:Tc1-like transposase DDE domain-containing protein n=1 Tax=Mucor lusitanicus CBS 277.49 TaxID=747725 RepID=A0A162YNC0_MUCCL|nr:hypothetical protein MUCCIDRAFT_167033 [Mucor lusitanicus CBS 277.49]